MTYLLYKLIDLYTLILIVRILASWFQPDPNNPVMHFLYRLTEPLLEQIRRFLPSGMMLDFSPMVAILLLSLVKSALVRM